MHKIGLLIISLLLNVFSLLANEKGISPGPSFKMEYKDYRVPLLWLTEPGNYGPGDYGRRLKFQERDRYYEIHVPPQHKPGQAAPIVILIHGGGSSACVIRYESDMDKISDANGFIAVYPAGTHATFKDRFLYWNAGAPHKNPKQQKVDDVAFITVVLDDLPNFFSIDKKRVYATGISNGAQMSYRLAARLPDRIAAIAPISAQRPVGDFDPPPSQAIPIIYFHGKKDKYLKYDGGETFKSAFAPMVHKSAPESIATWVKHNGCDPIAVETKRQGNAVMQRWGKCKDNADVVFWTLEDGGHTWPGGFATRFETEGGFIKNESAGVGPINRDIKASQLMWIFFKQHSLE